MSHQWHPTKYPLFAIYKKKPVLTDHNQVPPGQDWKKILCAMACDVIIFRHSLSFSAIFCHFLLILQKFLSFSACKTQITVTLADYDWYFEDVYAVTHVEVTAEESVEYLSVKDDSLKKAFLQFCNRLEVAHFRPKLAEPGIFVNFLKWSKIVSNRQSNCFWPFGTI